MTLYDLFVVNQLFSIFKFQNIVKQFVEIFRVFRKMKFLMGEIFEIFEIFLCPRHFRRWAGFHVHTSKKIFFDGRTFFLKHYVCDNFT